MEQTEHNTSETYECLTHVAWEFGVPLRTLIGELEQAGYRSYGEPTRKALEEGLAIRRKGSGFHWSRKRVGRFIERHFDV